MATLAIGLGLGSAVGQPAQLAPGVGSELLATVEAGAEFPGHVLRMRRITFAPGASLPMHSHKDRPEVSIEWEGALSNTVKGNLLARLPAGTPVANGPQVEHLPANESDKPVVVISLDLVKKQ